MDHFLNCLDGGGGGIQGNFHENRMMQAHNGTLWNPSWKAVEMSQRAVPWSAFILTEHSKTSITEDCQDLLASPPFGVSQN